MLEADSSSLRKNAKLFSKRHSTILTFFKIIFFFFIKNKNMKFIKIPDRYLYIHRFELFLCQLWIYCLMNLKHKFVSEI